MKNLAIYAAAFWLLLFSFNSFSQDKSNLQKLVETEIAFAKAAEMKGTRAAFLEFLADDAVVFRPGARNGKEFWQAQPDSPALLAWSPAWADVSSDGNLGYTTGAWELRPKGKTDAPNAFGQYVTIWLKQADGNFKAVLDIGISHEKPASKTVSKGSSVKAAAPSATWKSPVDAGTGETKIESRITLNTLTDIFSKRQMSDALFRYLANDAIVLREGRMPFVNKTPAFLELEKVDKDFPPDSYLNFDGNISQRYGNMMYSYGTYKLTHKDKSVSNWNFLQIWKFRENRWQIVLDIFTPLK
jgi:ketosteroid isomerase-like protein